MKLGVPTELSSHMVDFANVVNNLVILMTELKDNLRWHRIEDGMLTLKLLINFFFSLFV